MKTILPLLIAATTVFNLVSAIPTIAQEAPICKNPQGRTRDRTNPPGTQRNAQGCVVQSYPAICATQNCFNCEDFQYQEDAQKFFNAFPDDPSGLDGRPGQTTAGCLMSPVRIVRIDQTPDAKSFKKSRSPGHNARALSYVPYNC